MCDALFLGLGSSNQNIAQRALNVLMPGASLDPTSWDFSMPAEEALALLQTAVERYYTSHVHQQLLYVLVHQVPSVRQLTPSQLLPVVQRAMALDSVVAKHQRGSEPPPVHVYSSMSGMSLFELDRLPAVQQIPSDALPGLLRAAMASGDSYSVFRVTSWSSFSKLTVEQLAELIKAAVQVEATFGKEVCSYYIGQLLKAPSYQLLDAATITAAMLVVVQAYSGMEVFKQLKQADAAAHEDVLLPVAVAGMKTYKIAAVRCLLDLASAGNEAASRISAKGLCALLQTALEIEPVVFEPDMFESLWQLPAAADLSGEDLTVLLRCAAKLNRWEVVQYQMQMHKAWASINEEDRVVCLLQLSVQQGEDCQELCASPHAALIDAETVWHLVQMTAAAQRNRHYNRHHSNLQALLQLPAAAQLSSQQILDMMDRATRDAARSGQFSDQVYHPEAPPTAAAAAADSPTTEPGSDPELRRQMQGLHFSSSTIPGTTPGSCLSVLCHWRGAAAIGAAGLLQLLQTARAAAPSRCEASTGCRTWAANKAVMLQLCSSKAAGSISSAEQLQPLLEVVLSCRDAASVKALLQCPAAGGITPAMFSDIMQSVSAQCALQWNFIKPGSAAPAAATAAASGCFSQQRLGVTTEQLMLLLQVAVQKFDGTTTALLCSYPAASQISSSMVQTLLLAAAAPPQPQAPSSVGAWFPQPSGGDESHQVTQCFVPDFTQLMKAASTAGGAAAAAVTVTGKTSRKAGKHGRGTYRR
jgi:hypothetical protein